jgi:hypothetical protein
VFRRLLALNHVAANHIVSLARINKTLDEEVVYHDSVLIHKQQQITLGNLSQEVPDATPSDVVFLADKGAMAERLNDRLYALPHRMIRPIVGYNDFVIQLLCLGKCLTL